MDEVGDIEVDFSRAASFPRPAVFD